MPESGIFAISENRGGSRIFSAKPPQDLKPPSPRRSTLPDPLPIAFSANGGTAPPAACSWNASPRGRAHGHRSLAAREDVLRPHQRIVRDTGFEPVTPSVSGRCSTTELTALFSTLSTRECVEGRRLGLLDKNFSARRGAGASAEPMNGAARPRYVSETIPR